MWNASHRLWPVGLVLVLAACGPEEVELRDLRDADDYPSLFRATLEQREIGVEVLLESDQFGCSGCGPLEVHLHRGGCAFGEPRGEVLAPLEPWSPGDEPTRILIPGWTVERLYDEDVSLDVHFGHPYLEEGEGPLRVTDIERVACTDFPE